MTGGLALPLLGTISDNILQSLNILYLCNENKIIITAPFFHKNRATTIIKREDRREERPQNSCLVDAGIRLQPFPLVSSLLKPIVKAMEAMNKKRAAWCLVSFGFSKLPLKQQKLSGLKTQLWNLKIQYQRISMISFPEPHWQMASCPGLQIAIPLHLIFSSQDNRQVQLESPLTTSLILPF